MTLLELCEPLFQYICRVNRSGRIGGTYAQANPEQVRSEVRAIFSDLYAQSVSTPGLREQYEKMRLPLIYFVDHMIRGGKLPFAGDWSPLQAEEPTPIYTGDDDFFDHLDQAMHDRAESANDRLAVFYACMGLGFVGSNDPEAVRRRMKEIAARIRNTMDSDEASRLCPDAYEYTNREDFTTPPRRSLLPIGVSLLVLLLVLFIANVYLYSKGVSDLGDALKSIIEKTKLPKGG